MEEAVEILDRMLRDYAPHERRLMFSEGQYHFWIGMLIRNSWYHGRSAVNGGLDPSDAFQDGFLMADDFSEAVREAYLRHLDGG